MKERCLLTDTLFDPAAAGHYSAAEWDLLLRQARAANLLAQLGVRLAQHPAQTEIPHSVAQHLRSARLIVKRQNRAIRWEVSLLQQALYDLAVPIVVLKGAAYVLAGLPNSDGRLFHDIDILVPRSALKEVEARLRRWGWRSTHNNAYDQRYYRRWMHELPPLQHIQRQTVLDVHHSILPLTARLHPDPGKLIANAVADPANEDIYWLAPEDMLLHSMTHLFHDGELENGLRDLVDMEILLNHFGTGKAFWARLTERAELLELGRPLYYGLRYVERVLQRAIPAETAETASAWGPGWLLGRLMDFLFLEALQPAHTSCNTLSTSIARWMLYVRSHYLRMPLRLLIPHLVHKAVVKEGNGEIEIPKGLRKIIADADKG